MTLSLSCETQYGIKASVNLTQVMGRIEACQSSVDSPSASSLIAQLPTQCTSLD